MAISGSDYVIDFTAAATEDPFVDGAWTDVANSFENLTGGGNGIRPNGFALSVMKLTATATAAVIKSKIAVTTNIGVGSGDNLGAAIIDNSTGNYYILQSNGTNGVVRKSISGTLSSVSSTITLDVTPGNIYELWYEPSTGTLTAVQNDVSLGTYSDTDLQASTLCCGIFGDPQNNNGRRIGSFGADYIDVAGVTIDSTPTDNRATESRTIRVTAPTTAMTTGNTTVKINSSGNSAITPSAVTNISGLTYDVVYTVPDEYAGLPYSATGYGIIVTTTDGSVTSANVPFLPVTGNGYITLTDVSDVDFDSDVAPAIGDQAEWTNDAVISLDSLGKITSSEAVTTFDLRLWDDTDNTWGNWAEQTWGSGGGGGSGLGLTTVGLTILGLTIDGLTL